VQLEFHQLDLRWEHLRVRDPQQQRHLLASLAENGQQVPIVVVAAPEPCASYVVIDGFQRIAALRQLGWDAVAATVWSVSEAEALLLERSLRAGRQETALEQGWLLSELEHRFGYSLEQLARCFDRSVSWVSRRLGLVELLPEQIQQQVRDGRIAALIAMRYLVPMARVSLPDCEQMAAAFRECHCDSREAGQLYAAWRAGPRSVRERILSSPALFLKTQRAVSPAPPAAQGLQRDLEMAGAILGRARRRLREAAPEMNDDERQQARSRIDSLRQQLDRMEKSLGKERGQKDVEPGGTDRDSGDAHQGGGHTRDGADLAVVASDGAQRAALELHCGSGDRPRGESRTLPATDPGVVGRLQRESHARP
jgi:ParB/RepB/Spo0J family partition protein